MTNSECLSWVGVLFGIALAVLVIWGSIAIKDAPYMDDEEDIE